MEKLGLNEIRKKYLDFFESKNHLRIKSFPLVPENDKSLLLINSGMAPLKPYFTGQQIPPKKRVTTCQKCIRTGDIENVGKTARHGTFFEMLGNFSFGDYFKKEAIKWSWEFFTEVLKLPEDRLYISVYQDDNETFDIWNKVIGIPANKIFRLGKEDNFWEHGTGPCGPCSEIYFDKGEKYGCKSKDCKVGCECDRYMEVWNLVFTQFNKEEDGTYSNLENPNIDTGMGLERIATVMQDVSSIFDVDTIKSIRDAVCKISKTEYNLDPKKDISIRVITDHIRSMTFMTADGVLPSNEGRGYVLRRLIRRATRHGRMLGIKDLFLSSLSKIVIDNSGEAYPELVEKQDYINKILTVEEEKFNVTIDQGMELLKEKIKEISSTNSKKILNGKNCFKLYDTYGFPLDLMKEILEEEGIEVDENEFLKEMDAQKNRARESRAESNYMGAEETVFHKLPADMKSEFLGYNNLLLKNSKILALVSNNNIVEKVKAGENVVLILDKTPFYAEMGGQTGDIGNIFIDNNIIEVNNCTNFGGNKILHYGFVKSGEFYVGQDVNVEVAEDIRLSTARNHTATHLLHKALKEVLGNHVEQAGSLVSKDRLRFDFTHFEPLKQEELLKIENLVNTYVLKSCDVKIIETDLETAKKQGATALFGEKYGNIVRVVNIGGYSVELCGGTHLKNSSQIGSFKITSESGVAAGVRRIEAVTGFDALALYSSMENTLINAKKLVKANSKNFIEKIESLLDENKKLSKEVESLKSKFSNSLLDDILKNSEILKGVKVINTKLENMDMNGLRSMGDKLKERLDEYILVLASISDNKVNFVSMCSPSAINMGVKAGDIVKIAAVTCDGGGGGRPDMAQAGGKNIQKIDEALTKTAQLIREKLI